MKNKKILIIIAIAIVLYVFLSSYGSAQYGQINRIRLAILEGEYRPTDEDLSWMILTIDPKGGAILDDSPGVPYLAIFDDEAGNPGVEGEIIGLDEDTIIIKISKGFYESLPHSGWKTTDNDSRLEMHYERFLNVLTLENNGEKMKFYLIGK